MPKLNIRLGEEIPDIVCICKKDTLRWVGRFKDDYEIECQNCFRHITVKELTSEGIENKLKEINEALLSKDKNKHKTTNKESLEEEI